MAHPFQGYRENIVAHDRVARIALGRASGGRIKHSDEAEDKKLVKSMVKSSAMKMDGSKAKARLDRPQRADGGRVGKGKTNVTINVLAGGQKDATPTPIPVPVGAPPMPPRPPMMPPPMAAPGGGPPMPPPGPIRRDGGRAYANGGRVYEEGLKAGTQPVNSPGKNDQKDVFRGRQVTYKNGGAVEAGPMGPKFKFGAGGERGRQEKIKAYGGK